MVDENKNFLDEVNAQIAALFAQGHPEFFKDPARLAKIIHREPWEVQAALAPVAAKIKREEGIDVYKTVSDVEC